MHTKVPREGSLTGLSSSCISARSYNFFHFKNNPVQTSVCRGSAIRVRDTSSFGINVNIPCCSQHANRNWQGFFLIPLTFSSSCFGQRCECFTPSCLFMSALTMNNWQATKPRTLGLHRVFGIPTGHLIVIQQKSKDPLGA